MHLTRVPAYFNGLVRSIRIFRIPRYYETIKLFITNFHLHKRFLNICFFKSKYLGTHKIARGALILMPGLIWIF